MNTIKNFWLKLLSWVRIQKVVGGLEISDSALRYAKWDGISWATVSLRLPPGAVSAGRVEDKSALLQALLELKKQIGAGKKKLDAVVTLSSTNVYSQIFSLPIIEGANLEKAIQLNLQMASPDKSKESYSGWQMVGEDQSAVRLEILSAFVPRETVDGFANILKEAGFMVHSVEPRAFSLARVAKELGDGFDPRGSYIMMTLDEEGMEFLVLRRSQLYFQYFTPWRDVAQDPKQISEEDFRSALLRSFNQVINFYNGHWGEPLAGVWIATTAFKDEIFKLLSGNFPSVPLMEFKLKGVESGPEWLVVMGSALRGFRPANDDKEISLLGISAQEEFKQHQVLDFLEFWYVLLPVSLAVMLAAFGGVDLFLRSALKEARSAADPAKGVQVQELNQLQDRLNEFNRSVSLISSVMYPSRPKFRQMDGLVKIMNEHQIREFRLGVDQNGSAALSGTAPSETELESFSTALQNAGKYGTPRLELSRIRSVPQGVSFDGMTFSISEKTN